MAYLAQILAAAAVLVAYDFELRLDVRSPLGAAALLIVPYLLMASERRLVLRGAFRSAGAIHTLLSWWGPAAFLIATCGLGWPELVQLWTGAENILTGWPDGAFALTLAPFLAYSVVAIDATARVNEVRGAEIARSRRFQLRLLLAALAPFALFLGVTGLIGLSDRARANVEHVALWSAVMTLSLGALAMLTLPALLRRTWDTVALPPGRARQTLEEFARHVGFRFRELLVWRTGHQMANAAVVGVGPGQRVVVFSDLLLAQLPLRELVAVMAHEIGHAARHHVLTFIAWSAALFLGLELALRLAPEASETTLALAALVSVAAWWLGFGWLSRRSELEADLYAMESTGDVQAMVSALEIVGGPHARSKDSWRHFSTARRIDFLERAAQDDSVGRRLTRQMRWWSRIGVTAALSVAVAHGWTLFDGLPDERVRVELALGEYERADELATRDGRVLDSTRQLAQIGLMLGDGERTRAGLESAALRALERGDARRCAELLELLSLRGESRADELLAALQSTRLEDALGELRATAPQWADALEAALKTGSR